MRYIDTLLGKGPRLYEWLRTGLAEADAAAIRTGFLSAPAVEDLTTILSDFLARDGRLLIVVGGAPDQADPDALVALSGLLRHHQRAALRVVVHPDEFQNAKTYHLTFPDGHTEALVGSPNLTRGGMDSNHEAAVVLDSRQAGETEAVTAVLQGIEVFRDRPRATPVSDDTRLLLSARQTALARRHGRRTDTRLHPTEQWEDLLEPAIERMDAAAEGRPSAFGLATGFGDLDEVTSGLAAGSLTVIASRAAVGRSTLLRDIVRHAAIRNRLRSLLFCFDQSREQIAPLILSAEAIIRPMGMRSGRMTDDEWIRMARRTTEIAESPLLLNTTPAADLDAICTHVAELHQSEPLHLVAIDPLNMIDAGLDPSASREREISRISRRLKILALELNVPIVVTAELGRTVEARTDKQPELGDLRDSDTLSQVADNVLLLHRPDAYDWGHPRAGEADLLLVKHRDGRPVTITVAHQLHYGRFVDLVAD